MSKLSKWPDNKVYKNEDINSCNNICKSITHWLYKLSNWIFNHSFDCILQQRFHDFSCFILKGKPIQCWIPQEFTRGWEEYAENYCWVSNTYFSPLPKRLPPNVERPASLIVYYQWAPILMAIQALLFYLPCLIWRLFSNHSGFNVRRIMQMASDSNILLPEHGMKNVRFIARYMEGCIYRQRDYKRSNNAGTRGGGPTSALAFPYHASYRTGLQHFTETPNFSPSVTAGDVPPPNYTKTVFSDGPPDNRPRSAPRSIVRGELKRSNGEASASVNLGRRYKHGSSLCARIKSGMCLRGGRTRRNRKALNPITDSPALTGVISTEHTDNGKCFKNSRSRSIRCCGRRSGNFLVVLYFFVKVLYLINLIGQLVIMEKFIGTNHAFYGIRVLLDLIQGTEVGS